MSKINSTPVSCAEKNLCLNDCSQVSHDKSELDVSNIPIIDMEDDITSCVGSDLEFSPSLNDSVTVRRTKSKSKNLNFQRLQDSLVSDIYSDICDSDLGNDFISSRHSLELIQEEEEVLNASEKHSLSEINNSLINLHLSDEISEDSNQLVSIITSSSDKFDGSQSLFDDTDDHGSFLMRNSACQGLDMIMEEEEYDDSYHSRQSINSSLKQMSLYVSTP